MYNKKSNKGLACNPVSNDQSKATYYKELFFEPKRYDYCLAASGNLDLLKVAITSTLKKYELLRIHHYNLPDSFTRDYLDSILQKFKVGTVIKNVSLSYRGLCISLKGSTENYDYRNLINQICNYVSYINSFLDNSHYKEAIRNLSLRELYEVQCFINGISISTKKQYDNYFYSNYSELLDKKISEITQDDYDRVQIVMLDRITKRDRAITKKEKSKFLSRENANIANKQFSNCVDLYWSYGGVKKIELKTPYKESIETFPIKIISKCTYDSIINWIRKVPNDLISENDKKYFELLTIILMCTGAKMPEARGLRVLDINPTREKRLEQEAERWYEKPYIQIKNTYADGRGVVNLPEGSNKIRYVFINERCYQRIMFLIKELGFNNSEYIFLKPILFNNLKGDYETTLDEFKDYLLANEVCSKEVIDAIGIMTFRYTLAYRFASDFNKFFASKLIGSKTTIERVLSRPKKFVTSFKK